MQVRFGRTTTRRFRQSITSNPFCSRRSRMPVVRRPTAARNPAVAGTPVPPCTRDPWNGSAFVRHGGCLHVRKTLLERTFYGRRGCGSRVCTGGCGRCQSVCIAGIVTSHGIGIHGHMCQIAEACLSSKVSNRHDHGLHSCLRHLTRNRYGHMYPVSRGTFGTIYFALSFFVFVASSRGINMTTCV